MRSTSAWRFAARACSRLRYFECARVDLDDRVEARTLLVVGVDAREVQRDEALVRQSARRDSGLDVRDARGQQVERSGLRGNARTGCQQQRRDERGHACEHWASLASPI
jgi:hypothetical protein